MQPRDMLDAPSAAQARMEEDRLSLPAWIYHDPEFLAAEFDRVFRPSWQIVCHLSDIPAPGCYHTLALFGETIVVVR